MRSYPCIIYQFPWFFELLTLVIVLCMILNKDSLASFILLLKTTYILLLCNWICRGQECHDDHPWHLLRYWILFWAGLVKQVSWKSFILLIKSASALLLWLDLWRTGVSWWPSMIFTPADVVLQLVCPDVDFNTVCYFEFLENLLFSSSRLHLSSSSVNESVEDKRVLNTIHNVYFNSIYYYDNV